jgi:Straboviridae polynucleotide kinase
MTVTRHERWCEVSEKTKAVIFDRDGTLASCFARPLDRSNASWTDFNAALRFDAPVPVVCGLLRSIRPGITRIMVSGRAEGDHPGDRRRRFAMQDWVAKHSLPVDLILMRSGGDMRLDSVVKHEILHDLILPRFDVLYAVDDRPQVAQVWRDHGIPVLEVTDPDTMPWLAQQDLMHGIFHGNDPAY